MRRTLLIKLNGDEKPTEWLWLDEKGKISQGWQQGELSTLSMPEKNYDVFVLVPTRDVLITAAEVPNLAESKLRKAVPFAIEEQLSQPIDQLHFAIGTVGKNKLLPVLVTSHDCMQGWMTTIPIEMQHNLRTFMPSVLLTPWQKDEWTVCVTDNEILVRTDYLAGFSTDSNQLITLLKRQLEIGLKPKSIRVINHTSTPIGDELSDSFDVEVEETAVSSQLLTTLSHQVIGLPINLLQGDYQTRQREVTVKKLRLSATIVAAVLLVFLSLMSITKYAVLSYENNQLQKQMNTVYKEIFPKATTVVNPRRRIERLLIEMKENQQDSGFLRLMAHIAPTIISQKNVTIQRLSYDQTQLNLQIHVNDFLALDQFVTAIRKTGVVAEQRSATKSDKEIEARIIVKEA